MKLWADMAGSEVENKGNIPCVIRGVTEVDSNSRAGFPFGCAEARVIIRIQNKDGASPGMMIRGMRKGMYTAEGFLRGKSCRIDLDPIMFFYSSLESERPKDSVDSAGPLSFGVKKESAGRIAG